MGHIIYLKYKNYFNISLLFIVLVVCTFPGFYVARYGALVFDEPYHIMNSWDYTCTPLTSLSSWLGSLIGPVLDWRWIRFRYLALVWHSLAILIGCLYMFYRNRNFFQFLGFLGSLLLLGGVSRVWQNVYGWDTWGLPLFPMVMIAFLEYCKLRKKWLLVFMGIVTSILTFSRFPNIILFIFLLFSILFLLKDEQWKFIGRKLLLFLFVYLVSNTILILGLYHSFGNYWNAIHENSMGGHVLIHVFNSFLNAGLKVPIFMALMFAGFKLLNLRYSILGVILLALVFFRYLYETQTTEWQNVHYFEEAYLFLAFIMIYFYKKSDLLPLLGLLLISIIPSLGSDTGMIKNVTLPLIPILITFLPLPILAKYKTISISLYFILIGYSLFGLTKQTICDVGIPETVYELKSPKVSGIYTSKEKGEKIDGIISDFSVYAKSKNVLVLRNDNSFIYEYILGCRNQYLRHYFGSSVDNNDLSYVKWVNAQIDKTNGEIAILYLKAYNPTSELSRLLDNKCVKVKDKPEYSIYIK